LNPKTGAAEIEDAFHLETTQRCASFPGDVVNLLKPVPSDRIVLDIIVVFTKAREGDEDRLLETRQENLSNPVVSCVDGPSSKLMIRRPYSDSPQKRKTIRLPSGTSSKAVVFPHFGKLMEFRTPSRVHHHDASWPAARDKIETSPKSDIQSSLGDHSGAIA